MKLLLDENLSPRIVRLIQAHFPAALHVESLGLRGRSDIENWERARSDELVIVPKDGDFRQRSLLLGAPPKVISLSVGNAGTDVIAHRLVERVTRIQAFALDAVEAMLVIDLDR